MAKYRNLWQNVAIFRHIGNFRLLNIGFYKWWRNFGLTFSRSNQGCSIARIGSWYVQPVINRAQFENFDFGEISKVDLWVPQMRHQRDGRCIAMTIFCLVPPRRSPPSYRKNIWSNWTIFMIDGDIPIFCSISHIFRTSFLDNFEITRYSEKTVVFPDKRRGLYYSVIFFYRATAISRGKRAVKISYGE